LQLFKQKITIYFEGDFPNFTFLEVRVDNPAASSLNLMIIFNANGKCADRYGENLREIQTALVQICNESNLTIPFSQFTVNMADNPPTPE